jgi:hypothetical protein
MINWIQIENSLITCPYCQLEFFLREFELLNGIVSVQIVKELLDLNHKKLNNRAGYSLLYRP